MNQDLNLTAARNAMEYTRAKMTIGAKNKLGDLIKSRWMSTFCVTGVRILDPNSGTAEDRVRRMAAMAEYAGCGNCGEQAAIAYMYLKERGVRPIELMHMLNVNHAIVVIGRRLNTDVGDWRSWNEEAVVCDPWKEDYFTKRQIPSCAHGRIGFKAAVQLRNDRY